MHPGAFYVHNAPNLPPLTSIPHRARLKYTQCICYSKYTDPRTPTRARQKKRHLLASCTWAKHLSDSRANCNIVCVSFATSTVS